MVAFVMFHYLVCFFVSGHSFVFKENVSFTMLVSFPPVKCLVGLVCDGFDICKRVGTCSCKSVLVALYCCGMPGLAEMSAGNSDVLLQCFPEVTQVFIHPFNCLW